MKEQRSVYEKAELHANAERRELDTSPAARGNELDGDENERRELDDSGVMPELAARRSVRFEAP